MNCFLDRDGIINQNIPYVGTKDRFTWCPFVSEIMRSLTLKGYKLIMITNQSGINRGYYSTSQFFDLSFFIINELASQGIDIEINFCPHHPHENCKCRKPNPGMILRYKISCDDIFIGDKETDMMAAFNAGINHRWILAPQPLGPYTKHFLNHNQLASYLKCYTS